MFRSDDPVRDASMHDMEVEAEMDDEPYVTCCECDEPIFNGDYGYYFCDEDVWYCQDCMESYRRMVIIDA